jgi:hypothetical protein
MRNRHSIAAPLKWILLLVCVLVFTPALCGACPMCEPEKPAAPAAAGAHCCCAQNGCRKAEGQHAPMCMCNAHREPARGSADAVPAASMPSPKLLAMACISTAGPSETNACAHYGSQAGAAAQHLRCPLFLLNQIFRI